MLTNTIMIKEYNNQGTSSLGCKIYRNPVLPVQHALDLQLAVANILQLLVNSERNQQVLCEACLHQRLLQRCSQALGDEDHPLHPPLQRMFERLASQALQPIALRY